MKIRPATLADITSLATIGKQTFTESFSEDNDDENMVEYLKNEFSKEKLSTQLANNNSAFHFAELDGEVIGYLKTNIGSAQNELKDNNSLEIERIYILKAYQGRRIGQSLFNKAVEIAKSKQLDFIWLGVWEKNNRAIKFYEKNGFERFDQHVFLLGNDRQIDLMMKLKLK